MSYVSMQQRQYIIQILQIMKSVAFHEIYMEKQRQQLCNNQFYDPLTAFKAMDAFKSGEIIGFELRGFLDTYNFKCSDLQCQRALRSVNKGIFKFGYDDFEELTLPKDSVLRNISLTRYKELQVEIGVMSKIYSIKNISAQKIAGFFIKQIKYDRQLMSHKQRFCQTYGGDLYSFSQIYFKGKKQLCFNDFYQASRKINYFFNQTQFHSIYRRTKSESCYFSKVQHLKAQEPQLTINMLSDILQTNELDIKQKLKIQTPSAIEQPFVKPPSYKYSAFQKWGNNRLREQYTEKIKFVENLRQIQRHPLSNHRCYDSQSNFYQSQIQFRLKNPRKQFDSKIYQEGNSRQIGGQKYSYH